MDNKNLKSYERYMFEDIYPEQIINEEENNITSYHKVSIYTEKVCEIIPELKDFLGKLYDELDILDFIYYKTQEKTFDGILNVLDSEIETDINEIIASKEEMPIVFSETDVRVFNNTRNIKDGLLRPENNEDYQKDIDSIGIKIRNLIQINYNIYIKVIDTDPIDEIQPRRIVLLDISQIMNKIKEKIVKDTPTKKKARRYRSFVTKEDMAVCKDEKNVQENYGSTLRNYKFAQHGAILRTDNIYSFNVNQKEYKLLAEFKFGKDMRSEIHLSSIIAQCLAYMKLIEKSGVPIPEVVLVGDENECSVFSSELLLPFLNDTSVNWNVKPSSFLESNTELFNKLVNSNFLNNIFVFDIDDHFEFKTVVTKINDLARSSVTKTKINPKNMATAFHYFSTRVLHKNVTLSANERVNLFIQILVNPDDNYLHPSRPQIVSSHFGNVQIDRRQFTAFMVNYEGFSYTNEEKEELVGVSDVIIIEEDRRKQGEYFTPDVLTIKADEYLSWYLGSDYKEKFFVWDCAAGTGNLTRNFRYNNLFQSTLHTSDLHTMKQSNINPEGYKFKFDFLNDDLSKIPSELMNAIKEDKPILIYMNPPYATANNWSNIAADETTSKTGVSDTNSGENMKKDNWGSSAQNLYSQFFYRIWEIKKEYNLNNLFIGVFCPELFMSGGSFDKFREKFMKSFKYENGFLTPASMFSDVSKQWGILFSIWSSGETKDISNFSVEVYDTDESDINLENKGVKILYNLDNQKEASKWVREKIKGIKTSKDVPQLTNALNVKKSGKLYGSTLPNSIGYFYNNANNVQYNQQNVSILSSPFSAGHGLPIIKDNYFESITLFSARKLIQPNWVNQKNEYLAPNENHLEWEQFKYDCIVYSIFNGGSNQSSIRDIDYNEKEWNIFNEFFYISLNKMMEVIRQSSNQELFNDIKKHGNQRYVAELLYDKGIYHKLSADAKYVLDEATKLTIKTIGVRDMVNRSKPELNANTWDSGWYQVRRIAEESITLKNDVKIVNDAYKDFEERLRPLVYELGFLK